MKAMTQIQRRLNPLYRLVMENVATGEQTKMAEYRTLPEVRKAAKHLAHYQASPDTYSEHRVEALTANIQLETYRFQPLFGDRVGKLYQRAYYPVRISTGAQVL